MTSAAKLLIEVVAGVMPESPMPEYTRRYAITSDQWEEAVSKGESGPAELLAETAGRAQGYAALLMLQPDRLNWVRTDWVWV